MIASGQSAAKCKAVADHLVDYAVGTVSGLYVIFLFALRCIFFVSFDVHILTIPL